jgi:gentisate 1,2-dioxygenase
LWYCRACDPCEWRHPWAPVEEALNASDELWAIHDYKQPNGKPLSNILGVRAERLHPGVVAASQDSCSFIYHCYEGRGRTEVETPSGQKTTFQWTSRDTFAIPAWSKVKHVNESDTEKAYLVACHDGPFLDCLGLRRPIEV